MRSLGPWISIAIVAMTLVFAIPSTASADPRGVFVVRCAYSHSLLDDPIVHPGEPGMSHLHDFFANTTTNATSTIEDMKRATSTCVFSRDTAGYWFPAANLGDARVVPAVLHAARRLLEHVAPVSLERLIERCLNEHVLCGNVRNT